MPSSKDDGLRQQFITWLERPLSASFHLNWEKGLFALILVLAVTSRFADLGARVMSHDENSHVYFSWLFSRGGSYQQDPVTHGPLQFHLVALSFALFGDSDFTARIPAAFFSLATLAFLWAYRRFLGRAGALAAAVLMLISPYMLFYGRYVRNESLSVFFELVSLWAMLHYLESGSRRDLYLLSVVTALNFTTKETAYIFTAQMLIFLVISLLARLAHQDLPAGKGRGLGQMWFLLCRERSFDLLVLQGTLVLPLLAAFPAKVLGVDPTRYDDFAALAFTALVVIFLAGTAGAIGILWRGRVWLVNAAVFYGIFAFFFTSIFRNGFGFFTGLVGSLGYWLAQQNVQRGEQPLYYYALLQIPIYEFLPALSSLLALALALMDRTHRLRPGTGETALQPGPKASDEPKLPVLPLLGYWIISSLVAYSLAGEKMPWLTVYITLPMILLGGWGIGRLLEANDWKQLRLQRGWLVAVLLALTLISGAAMLRSLFGTPSPFQGSQLEQIRATSTFLTALATSLASGIVLILLVRTWTAAQLSHLTLLLSSAGLALLTGRAAFRAAYIDYDHPTEYLVYAHSARSVKEALAQIEEISRRTTDGLAIQVAYDDQTRYPYWWYLRNFPNQYDYGANPTRILRDYPIILVGDSNFDKIEPVVGQAYQCFEFTRIWWPNMDYFKLKWSSIADERAAEASLVQQADGGQVALPSMRVNEYLRRAWDHIAPFFSDAQVRSAIWQVWLNRDYNQYAALKGLDMSLPNWQPSRKIRLYIRKDVLSRGW